MSAEYKPARKGATHIGPEPEREEFKVGAKGLLYRWVVDEWRNSNYDRRRLITLEEFKEWLEKEKKERLRKYK